MAETSIVHLWDEVASHYIWYSGLYLMLMSLAWTLRTQPIRLGRSGALGATLVAGPSS